LAGCMQTASPVAMTPRNDLDSLAYGQTAQSSYSVASNDSGGAISAVRASFAAPARGSYAPMPVAANTPALANAYAAAPAPMHDAPYHLDAGDRLRVVVYGQEGLTNTYAIDAGGAITMPLIGAVAARGKTPAGLAADISARLRNGYIREPSIAVEVETYRPFFILGEVAAPGQYPYVPNMSVESAVAIAGGFSPRAKRDSVTLTHNASRVIVPLGTSISPGDTILVGERWF
ncbi:MAG TPA: polysaccharide biosynthesis/export family protein, partial [Bradyrhizobium sp.]|uniref:polysaccharide biosynthesis/export family protein n=1 Tax=Bradyrhizobium sp. TaxID=376 RepID=UPI002D7FEECC